MLDTLFWFLAGLWNVLIATFWKSIFRSRDDLRRNSSFRASVFAFGIAYWLTGFSPQKFQWIIIVGLVLKLGVVCTHLIEISSGLKSGLILHVIIFGDFLWTFGFARYIEFKQLL